MPNKEERLLQLKEVIQKTGMSKTFIYDKMRAGQFPNMIKIGRSTRWQSAKVDDWIQQSSQANNNESK